MVTPPSIAPGNVHTLSSQVIGRSQTDLVLRDDPWTWSWTHLPWMLVHWPLEGEIKMQSIQHLNCSHVHAVAKQCNVYKLESRVS